MRRIANALCFALAFAIPAWVAAVGYPFNHRSASSPYVDANSAFQLFCILAFVAGAAGGTIYSMTLAFRNRNASLAKSVVAGIFTFVISGLSAFLLALLYGTESHWLRGFVLTATLIACAFACALLAGHAGPTRRSTRTRLRRAG